MNTYSSTNKDRIFSPSTKDIRTNDPNVTSKGTVITPVYLNLYDLGGCVNAFVHTVGLSFYHCAVQTHAAEYGFMGHPFKFTGIYKTSKHDSRFHLYRLRDTIEFGWTWFTENEIDEIFNEFKMNYFGCDYHLTKKNSIHFVRDFLVRLTNEINLKQIKSIDLNQFPSYIDRCRRWSENVTFLKYFDYEKEIAEINILYFLYMKFEGNLPRICRVVRCETIEQLKRTIKLIKQGIDDEKIPRFLAFQTTEMQATYECLHPNEIKLSSFDDEITLTDIFHQFDTITLRGRTSIDRYLNLQRNDNVLQNPIYPHQHHQGLNTSYRNEFNESTGVENNRLFNEILSSRSSFSDAKDRIKRNVLRQSFVSSIHLPGSDIKMNSFGKLDSFVSMPLVSTVEKSNVRYLAPVQTVLHLDETLHPTLIKDDLPSDSLSTNHFHLSASKKRKLPRDLQLSHDFYKLSSVNNIQQLDLTNNAICKRDSLSLFPTEISTDSTV